MDNPAAIFGDFVLSSGTANHVCGDLDFFKTYKPATGQVEDMCGGKLKVEGVGPIVIEQTINGKPVRLELKAVYCVPRVQTHLISVGRLLKDSAGTMTTTLDSTTLILPSGDIGLQAKTYRSLPTVRAQIIDPVVRVTHMISLLSDGPVTVLGEVLPKANDGLESDGQSDASERLANQPRQDNAEPAAASMSARKKKNKSKNKNKKTGQNAHHTPEAVATDLPASGTGEGVAAGFMTDPAAVWGEFILSNVTARHCCGDRDFFKTMIPAKGKVKPIMGDKILKIEGVGHIDLEQFIDGQRVRILLKNVHYVPGLQFHVISSSQLEEETGATITLRDKAGMIDPSGRYTLLAPYSRRLPTVRGKVNCGEIQPKSVSLLHVGPLSVLRDGRWTAEAMPQRESPIRVLSPGAMTLEERARRGIA